MRPNLILGSFFIALHAGAATLEQQVELAARAQLDQQYAQAGFANVQFDLAVVAPRSAPVCTRPLQIEPVDTRQPARMRFALRCVDAGTRSGEVVVRARVSAEVVVTSAPVAANEALSASQLMLEQRDITNVSDPVANVEAALGQSSRRTLRPGELLRTSQLSAPVLVKRGDAVTMLAHHELVEVSTAGEALDNGARGATIRVRNSASGQVLRMRVRDAGMVEPVDAPRINP